MNEYITGAQVGPDPGCIDPAPSFRLATVGGTFNVFHGGHAEYLALALAHARRILVWITSDELAARLKTCPVRPFAIRAESVDGYLRGTTSPVRYEIRPLESELDLEWLVFAEDVDLAVVEPAYLARFKELNLRRERVGVARYDVVLKERTRLGDLELTSTRLMLSGAIVQSSPEFAAVEW